MNKEYKMRQIQLLFALLILLFTCSCIFEMEEDNHFNENENRKVLYRVADGDIIFIGMPIVSQKMENQNKPTITVKKISSISVAKFLLTESGVYIFRLGVINDGDYTKQYVWDIRDGKFPNGLSLNKRTGRISGICLLGELDESRYRVIIFAVNNQDELVGSVTIWFTVDDSFDDTIIPQHPEESGLWDNISRTGYRRDATVVKRVVGQKKDLGEDDEDLEEEEDIFENDYFDTFNSWFYNARRKSPIRDRSTPAYQHGY